MKSEHIFLPEGMTAFGTTKAELVRDNGSEDLLLSYGDENLRLSLFLPAKAVRQQNRFSVEEIALAGRDILAEEILAQGEPTPERIEGLLPPIGKAGYAILGSQASWHSYSITKNGEVLCQKVGANAEEPVLFAPRDFGLSGIPKLRLLDGELPILAARFSEATVLFVTEPQDTDKSPALYVAIVKSEDDAKAFRLSPARETVRRPISFPAFFEILLISVLYWKRVFGNLASFELPNPELARAPRAAFGNVYTTFSSDHPHYGHRFYGLETHDWFPPTFLRYLEATLLYGETDRAKRMLEGLFAHGFDVLGRLAYRQGEEEIHGTSASEYGQFFDLLSYADRFREIAPVTDAYLPLLISAGENLLQKTEAVPGHPDITLISMCAEADTNNRIHVYLQNNLWAIRGFLGLSAILARRKNPLEKTFREAASDLEKNVALLLARACVETRFGKLPPFRAGYPATPHTLSGVRDTFFPMTDEEWKSYIERLSFCRNDAAEDGQDFLENTYANYRYYPEMLSSGLLPEENARAIDNMRRSIGGEVLGMTRIFRDRIDDWPVSHVADYLLATGQKDRYLLLLYAHLLHHGERDTGVYYEQRAIDGKKTANDCVPSALTVPLMLAKTFLYFDTLHNTLRLLPILPDAWKHKGFTATGLGTPFGKVNLHGRVENGRLCLKIELPPIPEEITVTLGAKDASLPPEILPHETRIERIYPLV